MATAHLDSSGQVPFDDEARPSVTVFFHNQGFEDEFFNPGAPEEGSGEGSGVMVPGMVGADNKEEDEEDEHPFVSSGAGS